MPSILAVSAARGSTSPQRAICAEYSECLSSQSGTFSASSSRKLHLALPSKSTVPGEQAARLKHNASRKENNSLGVDRARLQLLPACLHRILRMASLVDESVFPLRSTCSAGSNKPMSRESGRAVAYLAQWQSREQILMVAASVRCHIYAWSTILLDLSPRQHCWGVRTSTLASETETGWQSSVQLQEMRIWHDHRSFVPDTSRGLWMGRSNAEQRSKPLPQPWQPNDLAINRLAGNQHKEAAKLQPAGRSPLFAKGRLRIHFVVNEKPKSPDDHCPECKAAKCSRAPERFKIIVIQLLSSSGRELQAQARLGSKLSVLLSPSVAGKGMLD